MKKLFTIIFIFSGTPQLFVTGQVAVQIIVDGDTLALHSLPLENSHGANDKRIVKYQHLGFDHYYEKQTVIDIE